MVKSLRVLVADLPPILREIVARIATRSDMKVAASNPRRQGLAGELRRTPADVVILGLAESETPEVCSQILDEFPHTTVVGLAADGKRTALYIDDAGPDQLVETVRAASRPGGGDAHRHKLPSSPRRPF